MTSSGLYNMSVKPAQQNRDVPPSTRQFAQDYTQFYGVDQVDKGAYDSAKQLKDSIASSNRSNRGSGTLSQSTKPPSTRQFAKAYANFYDIREEKLNDKALKKVKDLKDGKSVSAVTATQAPT